MYDNYSPSLYGIVLKIVGHEEIAQDLLQEVFIKIWNGIGRHDSGKGKLFTWMLNIARNTAIDHLRSQRLDIIDIDTVYSKIEENQIVFSNSELEGIKEAVSLLKAEQRVLLEMVYWEGYTQLEAARRLKLPLGTVKTKIRIAIQKLRVMLSHDFRNSVTHSVMAV